MKCKKHLGDLSSAVGVCASCLRDLLFVLIAAQAKVQQQAQALNELQRCDDQKDHRDPIHRQPPAASQPLPPLPHPQTYPRSVSPRASWHRKSSSSSSCDRPVNCPSRHRRRFFSTPQVGPTFSNNPAHEPSDFLPEKKPSRFSLLSFLFRKRSHDIRGNMLPNPDPTSQPSSSSSIFSLLKKKKKKKKKNQSRTSSMVDSTVSGSACQRKCSVVVSNRGMSPDGGSDDEKDQDGDRSPSNSGYSSEGRPQSWKRTPAPSTAFVVTPRRTMTTPHNPKSRRGFVFCLSPLVSMSPSGNWKNKGGMPAEIGYSGNLIEAASFCKNRSRKLADFGRGSYLR